MVGCSWQRQAVNNCKHSIAVTTKGCGKSTYGKVSTSALNGRMTMKTAVFILRPTLVCIFVFLKAIYIYAVMFWMLWALLFAAWTFVATARQWTLPKHSLVPKAHQERIALTAPSRMRQCFHLQMNSIPEVDGRLFQCWKQRKENCNPMPASRKEKTRCWLMKNNWKERTNTSGTTTCLRKGLQGICEPRPVWLCFSCFGFCSWGWGWVFLLLSGK